MKESIFNLKKEELKKIKKEFYKSSFYNQYAFSYLYISILLAVPGMFLLPTQYDDSTYILWITYLMLIIGFIILFSLLYLYKTLDLMKQYYEEKININKGVHNE